MGGIIMCGLFGFSDPSRSLTPRQARQLLRALSVSSMVRGTDATGIAYNSHDRLHIYKRPDAANKTLLLPSASSHVVMGHVRMTTQGSAQSKTTIPSPAIWMVICPAAVPTLPWLTTAF